MGFLKSSTCSLAARLALAGVATLGGNLIVRHCRRRAARLRSSQLRLSVCLPESMTTPPAGSKSALEAISGPCVEGLVGTPGAPPPAIDGADSPTSVPSPPAAEGLSECKNERLVDEASTAPGQVAPLPASTAAAETATAPEAPAITVVEAAPSGTDDDCHPEGRSDSDSDSDRDEAPSPSGRQSHASYLSRHGLARCELIRVLGKGGFGRCELVSVPSPHSGGDPILAVRKVLFKRKDGVPRSEALQQEVRGTLAAKGCHCAVQLLGWSRPRTSKDPHELLLSYVPGVSLSEHLVSSAAKATAGSEEGKQGTGRRT